jgi:hypothetical protein
MNLTGRWVLESNFRQGKLLSFINQAVVSLRKLSINEKFFLLFGLSLLSRTISDLLMGRFSVATGELYQYRQRFDFPRYGTALFIFEVAVLFVAAGLLIARKNVRLASGLLILGTSMAMTQMFQHQKMLFLVVAFALVVSPRGLNAASVYFLRIQIVVVYVFSVVSKISTGFLESQVTLGAIEYSVRGDEMRAAFLIPVLKYLKNAPLNEFVIGFELLVPVLLLTVPRVGFFAAVILHLGMAVFLANVLPFSLLMIALALLYFPMAELKEATPS